MSMRQSRLGSCFKLRYDKAAQAKTGSKKIYDDQHPFPVDMAGRF